MKRNTGNTVIESLGAYLPPKAVSTRDVVAGCVNEVRFPIERITGIKERRMAGDTEFAIDLAINAVEDCFKYSKYTPQDIDLVICCNISHYDQHERYSFEPSGAIRLHERFGFDSATVYDISNACAGVFTGINIADAFLKSGTANRVLVVSGEYITHLTKTAQKEIQDLYDLRLACLTLGDSGVALILERSDRTDIGFQQLEMLTLGNYSPFCIAKATEYPHGGAIMLTQSAELSGVAVKEGAKHVCKMVWAVGEDSIHTMITHQTSKISIQSGIAEVNRILNSEKFNSENTINNLEKRGNTSTTSHFVAVMDHIQSGRIKSGENILFSVNASGVTLGTAVYFFDDLPDRIRKFQETNTQAEKIAPALEENPDYNIAPTVTIGSIGIVPGDIEIKKSTFDLANYAAKQCLEPLALSGDDLDLMIYSGVYRDEFLCEPAVAAMLAGDLSMRADVYRESGNSFAFDVLNGSLGFLNAIHTGVNMINSGKAGNALLLTSEIENNLETWPNDLMGIEETGAAMLLKKSEDGSGFGDFVFKKFPKYSNSLIVENYWVDTKPFLEVQRDERLDDFYVECIVDTVAELMMKARLDMDKIAKVFPPQISSSFIQKLTKALNLSPQKVVDVTPGRKDLFTSSIPHALHQAISNKEVAKGEMGLIISAGSGVQVGCVIYRF
ncbi:MAG: 3-oxoacyl-ACP synthase [Saprospiraceae bacterium]|nr:3-oxoacyl-ACP synthase [Saprospiraceae bacterium]